MRIPYIEYLTTNSKKARKFVVVDKQAMYFSTGENSGIEVPLPFLTLRGNIKNPDFKNAPKIFNVKNLNLHYSIHYYPELIVKFTSQLLNPEEKDLIPNKGHTEEKSTNIQTKVSINGFQEISRTQSITDFILDRVVSKKNLVEVPI